MTDKILVVLAESRAAESTLLAAGEAAERLPDARIEVIHVRVDPASLLIAADEMLTQAHREALEAEAAEEAERLKQMFDQWQTTRGVSRVTATWLDLGGTIPEEVGDFAKDAILVALGKLAPDSRGHARSAFNSVLFRARRPMLMVPRRFTGGFGHHLVIGWKDGETTQRAVAAALPWLKAANKVTVLRVSDNPRDDLSAARRLLDGAGVAADWRIVPFGGQSAGQRLLAEADLLSADGIVMGGYGRNRIIEWIFGGVTRDVVDETRLPVLMQH